HWSQEVRVERVQSTVRWRVTARRADREGEPDPTEDDRAPPVRCAADPVASLPFVSKQVEELVDRLLLLRRSVGHVSAPGTQGCASRGWLAPPPVRLRCPGRRRRRGSPRPLGRRYR